MSIKINHTTNWDDYEDEDSKGTTESLYHLDWDNPGEFQQKFPDIFAQISANKDAYMDAGASGEPILLNSPTGSKKYSKSQLKNTPISCSSIKSLNGSSISPSRGRKSVFVAYVLWLFGGVFGLHHFYLRRDRQAFIWATTLGGYFGIGWLGEAFKIRKYVEDTNEDPKFLEVFVARLRTHKKPPFSTNRFIGQLMVGYFWAQLVLMAVPEEEFFGFNFKLFYWLVPLAVGLGVWNVGNMGRQKGELWPTVLAAYVTYPIKWYIYDETVWLTLVVFASALTFEVYCKKWNREPPPRRGLIRRLLVLSICLTLYTSLWCSYFYFNGKITDSEGEEIPVRDAIHHFFTSPWWTDIKSALWEIYTYAQHHGWYEIWKQIIDMSDPHGENNAYKVLDLSPDASQSELTARWRKLSKEWHPDKVKDPLKLKEAQEKFMEIQQAYEILSKVKNKRRRNNKRST